MGPPTLPEARTAPVHARNQGNMQEITIEAGRPNKEYFKDLWRYRELFLFLSWRDILIRYKQTVIGIAWSVVRPVLTMIVFTIIFGRLAGLPSGGAPYALLVFAAMLPWQFFANTIQQGSLSLLSNSALVSKVFFPRLIAPSTSLIVSAVDFAIAFGVYLVLMVWYQFWPSWQILALPLFLLLGAVTALGLVLWISALNVKYRDFNHLVPFIVQFGLYISPVGFSSDVVPEQWRLLYSANPMVGVIDGFRWCLLGKDVQFYWPGLWLSVGLALVLLLSGVAFFRKLEKEFADVI
jgi:lipopolysaccharide transport system permease protein